MSQKSLLIQMSQMIRWFQMIHQTLKSQKTPTFLKNHLTQMFRWFQMIHQTLKSQKTPTFLKNHLTQMFQKILMSR
jgi:hypothetical protein